MNKMEGTAMPEGRYQRFFELTFAKSSLLTWFNKTAFNLHEQAKGLKVNSDCRLTLPTKISISMQVFLEPFFSKIK
jgi:hypothetical protein